MLEGFLVHNSIQNRQINHNLFTVKKKYLHIHHAFIDFLKTTKQYYPLSKIDHFPRQGKVESFCCMENMPAQPFAQTKECMKKEDVGFSDLKNPDDSSIRTAFFAFNYSTE